nr:hypothetical protein [Kibdelosporangium sp. MJ126-NF4]CEL15379.1 hypothetical protein [Kibdelosporangium sp. MJ126-NF4]CTQ95582.1 hypothetical protein [Kibdelosporangium sp. MJ126-NF4]
MWGLAETQFRNTADEMTRAQTAASNERAAREAVRDKHASQPGQRAPDRDLAGRAARRALAPR